MANKTRSRGKSNRKIGRNARKPGTNRRKMIRPDLRNKFLNCLQSCGSSFTKKWLQGKLEQGEPVAKYLKKL